MSNPLLLDPISALLAQTSLKNTLFGPMSRYFGLDTLTYVTPQGTTIVYVQRRFLPPSEHFQLIQQHTVTQGERLDNIAAQYLGDPTLFWRLCDANNTLNPDELTETIGRTIDITLPDGVTGTQL
jgi:nucleoid-associated protein YgaU